VILRRWTRHEYERLIDHGFLDEDDPIELLDGLLLVKEPQHSPHRTAVLLVAKAVERAFGEGWLPRPSGTSTGNGSRGGWPCRAQDARQPADILRETKARLFAA